MQTTTNEPRTLDSLHTEALNLRAGLRDGSPNFQEALAFASERLESLWQDMEHLDDHGDVPSRPKLLTNPPSQAEVIAAVLREQPVETLVDPVAAREAVNMVIRWCGDRLETNVTSTKPEADQPVPSAFLKDGKQNGPVEGTRCEIARALRPQGAKSVTDGTLRRNFSDYESKGKIFVLNDGGEHVEVLLAAHIAPADVRQRIEQYRMKHASEGGKVRSRA